MPKIVSQTICLYGADYLPWALRSVAPFVDEVYVFLTDQPSHGTMTGLTCPDTPEAMRAAIHSAGIGDKLRLIESRWPNEGAHRNEIFKYVQSGDSIVVVDADEVWIPERLEYHIAAMKESPTRQRCVRLATLWRSFDWICHDEMQPARLLSGNWPENPIAYSGELDMYHFGYARKPADIAYKSAIHGHVGEWRSDWFINKFLAWTPGCDIGDLHPTCVGFWDAKPFDKEQLPEIMRDHPYWNEILI